MKLSRYNYIIPVKGFTIIYNSFADNFVGVSHECANSLNHNLIEFQEKYDAFYSKFIKLGIIVDDEYDELSLIRANYNSAINDNKDLYIMIYPTQDCNLKCWYCYESHVANSFMNKETLETSFKAIKKKIESKQFNSLLVGFFGGEPLMNFYDIAYPLSRRLKKMAEEKSIKFATFFVTNGSFINNEMVDSFKEIDPFFQITLDGIKEKHNSVRKWKTDNHGTYDTIIKAIKQISNTIVNNFSDDPLITIRLNYDNQTLYNIDQLIDDLNGVNKKNILIHFERVWQTKQLNDLEQQNLLIDSIRKFIKAGYIIKHGVFKQKNVSCPSDTHDFMIINYDGNLFKCNGRTLTKETKEGELLSDGTASWDIHKSQKRYGKITFENDKCLKCKLLPLCMGPCSQKLLEEGSYCREICSLNSIDLSLEDFLKMEFEMRYLLQHFYN